MRNNTAYYAKYFFITGSKISGNGKNERKNDPVKTAPATITGIQQG